MKKSFQLGHVKCTHDNHGIQILWMFTMMMTTCGDRASINVCMYVIVYNNLILRIGRSNVDWAVLELLILNLHAICFICLFVFFFFFQFDFLRQSGHLCNLCYRVFLFFHLLLLMNWIRRFINLCDYYIIDNNEMTEYCKMFFFVLDFLLLYLSDIKCFYYKKMVFTPQKRWVGILW